MAGFDLAPIVWLRRLASGIDEVWAAMYFLVEWMPAKLAPIPAAFELPASTCVCFGTSSVEPVVSHENSLRQPFCAPGRS